MNTYYIVLTVGKLIEVQFKKDITFYEVLQRCINMYGLDLITVATSLDEAIKLQADWYINYGDKEVTRDISTVHHLEKCLTLSLDTNI